MTLSLIFALMTVVAAIAVVWPLYRRVRAFRSGSDVEVYRDQLAEVERDKATGLIAERDAEAARVEISRRLLAAADAAKNNSSISPAASATWRRSAVAITSLLLLSLGSAGLYLRLGSPGIASEPLASRLQDRSNEQSVEALVAKVEAHLQQHRNDGRGWEVLAPVYMRLGRYRDAVNAWRNALRLLGATAEREAGLGEAMVAEANGVVTADAKASFAQAVQLDANSVSARYYLGLAAEQDGKRDQAIKIWRKLIASAPPGAHWVPNVREALARLENNRAATSPGPSAAQMAAAANQQPAQRAAMIQSMVDRLAARLKKDGSDLDGWVRLVRSYKVLGETDKAKAATADARQAFAGDPAKLQRLNAALKDLNAGGSAAPAPGPSAAQMAAAANQQPAQQAEMIRRMVDRLAARLKKDGSDLNGWVRLVRSYKVLGQADKASAATADARQAFAGDPAKLQRLNAALEDLNAGGAAAPVPGPSATQIAAAAKQQPAQRAAMIQNMVNRLAARLKKDGSDLDGWVRLVRSYKVLGQADKASAATADARQAFADDPAKLQRLNTTLKDLDAGGAAAAAPGPSAAQMTTGNASPAHGTSIQNAVARLAERLKKSGLDPEGWLTLTRTYLTLGKKEQAAAAINDARHALAPDPEKLAQFNEALKRFKISE